MPSSRLLRRAVLAFLACFVLGVVLFWKLPFVNRFTGMACKVDEFGNVSCADVVLPIGGDTGTATTGTTGGTAGDACSCPPGEHADPSLSGTPVTGLASDVLGRPGNCGPCVPDGPVVDDCGNLSCGDLNGGQGCPKGTRCGYCEPKGGQNDGCVNPPKTDKRCFTCVPVIDCKDAMKDGQKCKEGTHPNKDGGHYDVDGGNFQSACCSNDIVYCCSGKASGIPDGCEDRCKGRCTRIRNERWHICESAYIGCVRNGGDEKQCDETRNKCEADVEKEYARCNDSCEVGCQAWQCWGDNTNPDAGAGDRPTCNGGGVYGTIASCKQSCKPADLDTGGGGGIGGFGAPPPGGGGGQQGGGISGFGGIGGMPGGGVGGTPGGSTGGATGTTGGAGTAGGAGGATGTTGGNGGDIGGDIGGPGPVPPPPPPSSISSASSSSTDSSQSSSSSTSSNSSSVSSGGGTIGGGGGSSSSVSTSSSSRSSSSSSSSGGGGGGSCVNCQYCTGPFCTQQLCYSLGGGAPPFGACIFTPNSSSSSSDGADGGFGGNPSGTCTPNPQRCGSSSSMSGNSSSTSSTTSSSSSTITIGCNQCGYCGLYVTCSRDTCLRLGPCVYNDKTFECSPNPLFCGGSSSSSGGSNGSRGSSSAGSSGSSTSSTGSSGSSSSLSSSSSGFLSSRSSSSVSSPRNGCTGLECILGGGVYCGLRGMSCVLNFDNLPACFDCIKRNSSSSSSTFSTASSLPFTPIGGTAGGTVGGTVNGGSTGAEGGGTFGGVGGTEGFPTASFSSSSRRPISPFCGNGIVNTEYAEECDMGALNSDTLPDRCRTDCSNPRCGDHILDSGEQCDDGLLNGHAEVSACDAQCRRSTYQSPTENPNLAQTIDLPLLPGQFVNPLTGEVQSSLSTIATNNPPAGQTGPAALAAMAAGAAAGWAWLRRTKKLPTI